MTATINIVIDLRPLLDVTRYATKNRPTLLKVAGKRYVSYLRNRYFAMASGGGDWPPLQESTIVRKERRGWANDPDAILRETDTLIDSIGTRTRGQYVYVGFVRNSGHPRGPSVLELARIHQEGTATIPFRQIIVEPNSRTKRQMVEDIKKEYNKIIKRKGKG